MAAGIGLNAGLRALLASRVGLDTIGHNITNANTPGYSRQRIDLAAARPIQIGGVLVGSGVDTSSVRRTVDTLLQRRLLTQTSVQGRLESRFTTLSEIEALLQEPDGSSLGAQLDGFFTSASSLSTDPADSILRTGMVNAAVQLTSQFNQLSGGLASIRQDTAREVAIRVDEANELAREISLLNTEIAAAKSAGLSPNDLLDQRDLAVSDLSRLIDVETKENANGAVRVLVDGSTLVSTTRYHELTSSVGDDGLVELQIEGAAIKTDPSGGVLGGLVGLAKTFVPDLESKLDRLAQNIIREVNRVHSTGIPASGPYSSLTGGSLFVDVDQDGGFRDELLSNAGLPADVLGGELFINVTDTNTGDVTKHRIEISRTHTTVGDFLDSLSAVPRLSADIDALGRMQIVADAGFGFDFSPRLDPNPDDVGAFGGGRASLGSAVGEPFALSDGDTLSLDVGGTPITVTFSAAGFDQIAEASAEEVAAALNADSAFSSNGLTASAVEGRLVVQTLGTGASESFTLSGGSVLGTLGWSSLSGTTITGHDTSVDVAISGQYTGSENDVYTFRPTSDGTVGTTPGLTVDVFDSAGARVATLEVGDTYVPGTELEVAQGVKVSFGLGELSAQDNDAFSLDVLADSDTADALVAVGLGGFFTGSGAEDIAIHTGIELDPDLIASSLSGFDGDNSVLTNLLDVEKLRLTDLGDGTIADFYGDIIGQAGFETASTVDALESNDALIRSLQSRQEQISGVNVDEELVNLLEFEQAFQAASRYINVLNQINDELLGLL